MTRPRSSALAAALALAALASAAHAQDLYVSDFDNSQVFEYAQSGALNRTFSAGGLFINPDGLAFSGGSLYVSASDPATGSGGVYRFNLSSPAAAPTLFASDPGGVLSGLVFGNGTLYAADSQQGQVVAFNAVTGAPTASFGKGALVSPAGLAFSGGSLYVSDSGANDVIRYSAAGVSQGAFIAAGAGGLQAPGYLTFDAGGNLYITSGQGTANGTLDRFNGAGVPAPSAGNSGAVFAADSGLFNPYGLAVGPTGAFFVGDRNSNNTNGSGGGGHYDQFSPAGGFVQSFAVNGGIGNPYGLAFGPASAPEPSGVLLTLVGAGGLGLRCVTQRRKMASVA